MPQVLITGASRGIGLALAREYAARGWRVRATCRAPEAASELAVLASKHDGVSLHRLDVCDHASIDALAAELDNEAIDLLCNNAGIGGGGRGAVDYARWRLVFETNVLGAMKTSDAFLPHVERSAEKKIVAISSSLGVIAATRGGNYPYRSSKAALNMSFRSLAMDLQPRGVTVTLLSPGIVDTDFTRGARVDKISPQESARGLVEVIAALGLEQSGAFLRHTGETLPW